MYAYVRITCMRKTIYSSYTNDIDRTHFPHKGNTRVLASLRNVTSDPFIFITGKHLQIHPTPPPPPHPVTYATHEDHSYDYIAECVLSAFWRAHWILLLHSFFFIRIGDVASPTFSTYTQHTLGTQYRHKLMHAIWLHAIFTQKSTTFPCVRPRHRLRAHILAPIFSVRRSGVLCLCCSLGVCIVLCASAVRASQLFVMRRSTARVACVAQCALHQPYICLAVHFSSYSRRLASEYVEPSDIFVSPSFVSC